jgi:hypothetical protein
MTPRTCCRSAAKWIAPRVGLAHVPKCPACLAAYVAMLTGVGISMPMAAGLRWGLIVLCTAALVLLASRQVLRWVRCSNR